MDQHTQNLKFLEITKIYKFSCFNKDFLIFLFGFLKILLKKNQKNQSFKLRLLEFDQ